MATKTARRAASKQVTQPGPELEATGAGELDPEKKEDAQDARDVANVQAKLADQAASNKLAIVDRLNGLEFVVDQSISQAFGNAVVKHFGGNADMIPHYRFSRRYIGAPTVILVDLFRRQQDYDKADVEGRRLLVHAFGGRYAAAGPGHSRMPHKEKSLREKYLSIHEQLEKLGAK